MCVKKAITKLRGFWLPGSTPEWTSAHKRFSYIAFGVIVVAGLSVPETIITANPWAREFTDFMAMLIPQIDNVSRVNLHSDANRFLYSLLWVISPLFLPLVIKEQLNWIEVEDVKKKREIDWSLHFLRLLFILMIAAWVMFSLSYEEGRYVAKLMLINHFWKSVFAPMAVAAALWPVTYLASLTISVRRGTYPGKHGINKER
jgi:hypothetical protein